MSLRIFNTLGHSLQIFEPIKSREVNMYVCGITPYDTTHLGHAFTYIFFDVLIRYLTFQGNKVKYVQNVTDIDDDILRKANETEQHWKELGKYWTDLFLKDMGELNWIKPNPYILATSSIPGIIQMVTSLITHGFAYETNGTIYFEVSKFGKYGKLGNYGREEMIKLSSERGADPKDPNKRNPLDFILWQKAKAGEPTWDSPWGEGRPGWHIECSAMSEEHLGPQIDIHGGGDDLIFPHHESEIAQTESFTGVAPFVKYWLHTGSVFYKSEKMSKSLGNLIMVSELLKKYSANSIRLLLLSHQWNKPWEFNMEQLDEAKKRMKDLEKGIGSSVKGKGRIDSDFLEAMDDNLNTPKALEILQNRKIKNIEEHLQLLGFIV